MRKIKKLIIHCSASDNPAHDYIHVIREWHIKERGFRDVGYHYFIRKNGEVEIGRPESDIGAHCQGENLNSIGICLSGEKLFTSDQFFSLRKLVSDLITKYKLFSEDVYPHNHFNKDKTCPNFNVHDVLFDFLKPGVYL